MAVEDWTDPAPPFGKGPSHKTGSIWDAWTPVIYKFPWGFSFTRGCLFAWFFLHVPYICFCYCNRKACNAVHALCCNPKPDTPAYCIPMYLTWIPSFILALIWILVTIILFFPWALFYILGIVVDCVLMFIYGITCCCMCCQGEEHRSHAVWRSFTCSGWIGEWNEGYDPYTQEIWNQWSPVRTLCDYNFPPV